MPDNKCRWKPYNLKCDEDALENDPDYYCILHSKNEDKALKDFTTIVENRLKGTKTKEGKEEIDLRGCYFPKNFPGGYFGDRTFDKPAYFTEATFSQKADFSWATFSQKAYFTVATFSQANFTETKFSQEADFREATFSQEANFYGATFSQEADFSGATFSQKANFGRATFSQEADFRGAIFSQEAYFYGATFSQKADFRWATFSKEAFFGEVTFSKEAYFGGATFSQEAYFGGATFSQEANFNRATFLRADFISTHFTGDVIFQDVDLSRCSFLHSNIDKVDFRYCKFGEKKNRLFRIIRVFLLKCVKALLGEIKPQVFRIVRRYILAVTPFLRQNVLRDELDCDKEVKSAKDKKKAREGYEPVRRVYLELKRNFEDKKDWNTAGDFHFGEMECRRKKMVWWKRYFWSLEFPYFLASGYGERPRRAFLILSALVFMVFPLLYMYFESKGFCTSVGYSFKASTLKRFGPVELHDNWSKFFSGLEFILVPLQTALLALALRRKVKR